MAPAQRLRATADSSSTKAPVEVKSDGGSPSWAELLGSNDWDGLLDPLDMSLRNWILQWGDLAQVTYDAFNNDEGSQYCGASRYSKADILARTFYPFASDYVVAELLYATLNGEHSATDAPQAFTFSTASNPWSVQSNFQGYVAVSTDEYTKNNGGRRVIYVAWRGTATMPEWMNNIKCVKTPVKPLEPSKIKLKGFSLPWFSEPEVMLGWYNIYTGFDSNSQYGKLSARKQLLDKIKELVKQYKDDDLSIVCVGHSLGGAIAVLSAFDIVLQGLSKTATTEDGFFPVTAVVFNSPRVGNKEFTDLMKSLPKLKVLHVKNKNDMVPKLPFKALGYANPGVPCKLDCTVSPYLNRKPSMVDQHDLQALLHTAAGWNSDGQGGFKLVVRRSLALVNKGCGYLNPEYGIPRNWWAEKNRGMVYNEATGKWTLERDEQPAALSSPLFS